jgi:DNA replication protein DnaC
MKLEVFVPSGIELDRNRLSYARRLDDLNGKTVGEISNRAWEADKIFPLIRSLLRQRYPNIKIIPYTEFPNGSEKISDNEALGDIVLEKGCDAVIASSAG